MMKLEEVLGSAVSQAYSGRAVMVCFESASDARAGFKKVKANPELEGWKFRAVNGDLQARSASGGNIRFMNVRVPYERGLSIDHIYIPDSTSWQRIEELRICLHTSEFADTVLYSA